MEMKKSQVSRRAFAIALAKVQPGEGSLPDYSVPEFRAKSILMKVVFDVSPYVTKWSGRESDPRPLHCERITSKNMLMPKSL